MSDHLARIVEQFLVTNRKEYCNDKNDNNITKQSNLLLDSLAIHLRFIAGHHSEDTNRAQKQSLLFTEFNECFRSYILDDEDTDNDTMYGIESSSKLEIEQFQQRVDSMISTNSEKTSILSVQRPDVIESVDMECVQFRRKMAMRYRVIEILWWKFNELRNNPNLQQRIRFDRISPHLLRFFTDHLDFDGNEIPRTISFVEILRVYPNAKTIMFVNRHLDGNGHNVSCVNEVVLENLINVVSKEKECPLERVVFLYYDYDGDIFDANQLLNGGIVDKEKRYFDEQILRNETHEDHKEHPLRKRLGAFGWTLKHYRIGRNGYKIRISITN